MSNPNGESTNSEWPSITCGYRGEHLHMAFLCVGFSVIRVVAFPMWCVWSVLWHSVVARTDAPYLVRYKFTFSNFTPDARLLGSMAGYGSVPCPP